MQDFMVTHLAGGSTAISCTSGLTGPCGGAQLPGMLSSSAPMSGASLAVMPLVLATVVACLARSDTRGA